MRGSANPARGDNSVVIAGPLFSSPGAVHREQPAYTNVCFILDIRNDISCQTHSIPFFMLSIEVLVGRHTSARDGHLVTAGIIPPAFSVDVYQSKSHGGRTKGGNRTTQAHGCDVRSKGQRRSLCLFGSHKGKREHPTQEGLF